MNRAGTPGSTREPGIQASGEGEGVPRHEQTVQEASHETGARARIAARIRERAGKRAVDRGEGGFARGRGWVEGSGEMLCGGLRRLEEHLRMKRIKGTGHGGARAEGRGT